MGYDLIAKKLKGNNSEFHFGAFSFPFLLNAFGFLFPAVNLGVQWVMAGNAGKLDKRFKDKEYPPILSNDGFFVTEEEAKIMARMARNYVAIQCGTKNVSDNEIEQTEKMIGFKIVRRQDFLDNFEKFADWAEKSGGFEIC